MTTKLKVLVTGATGQQGGAVARALLDRGQEVRALTRHPDGEAARALAAGGAEIVAGDFNDPDTLTVAAAGVDTVFLVTTPFEAGAEAETRQGIDAIDALKKADVGHVIYSSVASADQKTGIPHFDSKYEIEQHLAASGLNHTIAAPVWFMENLVAPWMVDALRGGKLAVAMPENRPLQQIAVEDIGAFIASLVERRESVFGQRFDIAGDELTGEAATETLSRALGRSVTYQAVPVDMVRQQSEDLAIMFAWFDRVGYSADIQHLRHAFPEVKWHSFAEWANGYDWRVLDAAGPKAA